MRYNIAVSRKKDLFLVLQPAVGEEGGGGEDEEGGEDHKPEESLQHHAPHQACPDRRDGAHNLFFNFKEAYNLLIAHAHHQACQR